MLFNNFKNNAFTSPFHLMSSTRFFGLCLIAMLFLFSCGKEEVMEEVEVTVPFAGTWSGSLSGDVNGNVRLSMVVQENGTFSMTFTPNGGNVVRGKVTADGQLEGGFGDTAGTNTANFTGTLQATRGSGDWDILGTTPTGETETGKGRWVADKDE